MVYYRFDKDLAIAVCTREEVERSYRGSRRTPAGEALDRLVAYLAKLGRGE